MNPKLNDTYLLFFDLDPIVYESANEEDIDAKRIEQLMAENLSGSQLDLVIHGDGDPFAPGHSKPNLQEQNELNKMFLESERTGGKNTSNNISAGIQTQELDIETSNL